jgi:hypothetical protein
MSPCSICGAPHPTDWYPLKKYSFCNAILSLAKENYEKRGYEQMDVVGFMASSRNLIPNSSATWRIICSSLSLTPSTRTSLGIPIEKL